MKIKIKTTLLSMVAVLGVFTIILGRNLIGNTLTGRVHFPREKVGITLNIGNKQKFVIFRRLTVDSKNAADDSPAVFRVTFKFNGLNPAINKRLSMIPTPFLIGMKGFREKCWTFNEETGYFQGIYQWESKEAAEKYPNSFILRLMVKRAVPGTVSYEILPDTDLSEYIQEQI